MAGSKIEEFSAIMQVQTCVVGAGVVGLAVARALALAGQEVVVLEAARAVGTGTSSRNSEVVHAGLYYAQGSLKARACVDGRRRLYEYCDSRGVEYRRCGKLIVATSDAERALLEGILGAGEANGVEGLRLVSAEEACELEPELRCVGGALLSPATGIVDSHGLMLALQGDAEAGGAVVALESAVEAAEVVRGSGGGSGSGIALQVGGERLLCERVVNAAGLHAPALAAALRGAGAAHAAQVPVARFARGCYFALQGQPSPFTRLVYPVPDPTGAGLGVHATVDLGGLTRFGPNVEWLDDDGDGGVDGGVGAQFRFGGAAAAAAGGGGPAEGGWGAAALAAERAAVERAYVVDPAGADSFYGAVRRYWPALRDGALAPDYAGIRPKLARRGAAAEDFRVVTEAQHGVRGLVHLFGIESPGLTASLALADHVARALLADGGGGR